MLEIGARICQSLGHGDPGSGKCRVQDNRSERRSCLCETKKGVWLRTALVTGVSRQNGAHLAKLLLEKGYKVFDTSRDSQVASFRNLQRPNIPDDLRLEPVALNDFRIVIQVLFKAQPDEIYNLAVQWRMLLQ